MKMVLQTVYDPGALQIIKKFVVETARFFGANSKETSELELATEEAAMLIISSYPDGRQDIFHITADGEGGLFKLVFNNMGVPINEGDLPEYTIDNPEESIDGLQLHLITSLTDNFYFYNRGAKGWQTILEKRLTGFTDPLLIAKKKKNGAATPGATREKLSISLATPEDAYEITKLAYYTYRYSYAKTVFYYPELLQKALEQEKIIAFVAKNSAGEIAAHCAYLRSAECSELAEIGALMSHPSYRKGTATIRMLNTLYNYPIDHDTGIVFTESNFVTSHTGSQRVTKRFDLTPVALKISMHERSDFIAIDDIVKQQRETLLYSVWAPRGLKDTFHIHCPERHKDLIGTLLGVAKFSVMLQTDTASPTAENTLMTIDKHQKEQLAVIEITEFGINWPRELEKTVSRLHFDHFITIHLHIPAAAPIPEKLENSLCALDFFFSGILAKTPRRWSLLYTCLGNQPFDFFEIQLSEPLAIELGRHIQTCYEALAG